ncbi:thymidine kinase, cytosolic-like [Planococcus citri]|uniref:thymidine kinase, cytosolic-like n=1 Tax=Planococcus citri TaxID=170843 RepID=UPI0031F7473B
MGHEKLHNHILKPVQQVIFGPMFSGKTTELIRRLKRYTFAMYRCLIIRYIKDTRYSEDSIASHDGQTLSATSCSNLYDMINIVDNFDVIGIDEGQFFQDSIISFAEEMANRGKIVIVAALDATFQRTEFGKILQLVPIAESVVKLNAVCMTCFSDASFTKRTTNEQEANQITCFQVELIGSTDKYMSVCRECHRQEKPVRNSPCKVYHQEMNNMNNKVFNVSKMNI